MSTIFPCLRRPTVRRARRCSSSPFASIVCDARRACLPTSSRLRESRSRMSTEKLFQDSLDNPSPRFYLLIFLARLRHTTRLGLARAVFSPCFAGRGGRRGASSGVWHDGSTSGVRASRKAPWTRHLQGYRWFSGLRHGTHLAAAAPSRTAPRGTVRTWTWSAASTPERFPRRSPPRRRFRGTATTRLPPARAAFDAALQFMTTAPAPGGEPCTFLLDEALELRTFESFPASATSCASC